MSKPTTFRVEYFWVCGVSKGWLSPSSVAHTCKKEAERDMARRIKLSNKKGQGWYNPKRRYRIVRCTETESVIKSHNP